MPESRHFTMPLPQLTGRKSKSSLRTAKTSTSVHSFDSLSSEPPTPTFSYRAAHGRHTSSASSVASSPPDCMTATEPSNSSTRLSKLAEEPPEPEDDCVIIDNEDDMHTWYCLCDEQPCSHTASSNQSRNSASKEPVFDFSESIYNEYTDTWPRSSHAKRSIAESSTDSIASRLSSRLQTWKKGRKPNFSINTEYNEPVRTSSSRSSSLSSSAVPGFDSCDNSADQSASAVLDSTCSSRHTATLDLPVTLPPSEPINRESLAATPLLPPIIVEARQSETPLQSPLQSPTMVTSNASFSANFPQVDTPPLTSVKSPPLSTRASVASLRHRPGTVVATSDIPPIMIAGQNDEWSHKLGHANFTIEPEPYLPVKINNAAVERMFADWQAARHNFTKHQVRTGEHFGTTSKIYKLSEAKWAEVDGRWKQNYEFAFAQAAALSATLPLTPDEPEPLMRMPSLDDPKEKFPSLGDQDIVGPMIQFAPQPQPTEVSRVNGLLAMLKNLKLPSGTTR